eukprot:961543-Prymnesium_polylepis.1
MALGRTAKPPSSESGVIAVWRPFCAGCGENPSGLGRLRASRPMVSFAWRRPTCASVHSAALSACCQ